MIQRYGHKDDLVEDFDAGESTDFANATNNGDDDDIGIADFNGDAIRKRENLSKDVCIRTTRMIRFPVMKSRHSFNYIQPPLDGVHPLIRLSSTGPWHCLVEQ